MSLGNTIQEISNRWKEYKKKLDWEQLPIFTLEYEKVSLMEGTDDKL